MIVTSYTSLVIESHRADCAEMLQGLPSRLRRRRSRSAPPDAYADHDVTLLRLNGLRTRPAEVTDFAHIASGKIRGAA
jgi:hypothetical protein